MSFGASCRHARARCSDSDVHRCLRRRLRIPREAAGRPLVGRTASRPSDSGSHVRESTPVAHELRPDPSLERPRRPRDAPDPPLRERRLPRANPFRSTPRRATHQIHLQERRLPGATPPAHLIAGQGPATTAALRQGRRARGGRPPPRRCAAAAGAAAAVAAAAAAAGAPVLRRGRGPGAADRARHRGVAARGAAGPRGRGRRGQHRRGRGGPGSPRVRLGRLHWDHGHFDALVLVRRRGQVGTQAPKHARARVD